MKKFMISVAFVIILILTMSISAFAAWERENNDSMASATTISTNTNVSGNLSNNYDKDWYKFTTTSNGYFNIEFTHELMSSNSQYWKIYLYDSTGVKQIDGTSSYFYAYGNANLTTSTFGISAGTYYVMVMPASSYSYSGINYNLKVNFTVSSTWETENNNSKDKADLIKVNKTYQGALTSNNDVDWYKFTTTSNGYFNIEFTHELMSSNSQYWKIYLYDSTGVKQIDGTSSYFCAYGNANLTTVTYGVPAGTYYVIVMPMSSYSSGYSEIDYNLRVNFTASNKWETENNNSKENADLIKANETYQGALTSNGDVDWYQFTLTEDGYFDIDFEHEVIDSSGKYWYIRVYDSTGVNFVDGTDSYFSINGNSNGGTNTFGVTAGTYYIKITQGAYYSGIAYNFTVNFTSASDWETENNSSKSNADKITINTAVHGALSTNGDVDWYSFNITEPGVISLSFSTEMQEDNGDYWDISIRYGDNPDLEIWRTHVSGYTKQTESCKVGVSPGTYFVEIESGGKHTASPYKMKINYEASNSWEQEANGTWKTANPIELNKKYYGSLCKDYSDEKDYYSFTLSEPNVIVLKLYTEKANSNSKYYDISIRDKDNPDFDLWQTWVTGYSTYTESCYLGLSAGTYYFEIEAGAEWTTDTYSFEIATVEPNGVWEQEQNGTWRTATPVNLYEKNYGTLRAEYGSEQDWFSFVIPSEMTINLNFYNPYIDSSSSYWDVSVRDKDNPDTDLWQKHINGNQTNVISDDLTLSGGTYYVEIESANQWSTLPYYFVLSTKHSCGGNWSTSQQPTCTETGKEEMYCNTCGKLLDSQSIPAYGHTCNNWVIDQEATCSSEGERHCICSVCGETVTEIVNMLNHEYGPAVTEVLPTCHSTGKETITCKNCGYSESTIIPLLTHVFGEWYVAKEATCYANGTEERKCSLCGDVETATINRLTHEYSDWTVVSGNKLIPPIVKEKKCIHCGDVQSIKDWSNVWISIVVGIATIGVIIGFINYIRAFNKK